MPGGILTKSYTYFLYTCTGPECSQEHNLIPNQGQQNQACSSRSAGCFALEKRHDRFLP